MYWRFLSPSAESRFLLIDTAGVREDGAGEIERQGIERAHQQFELADIILWLGPENEGPSGESVVEVAARSDHPEISGQIAHIAIGITRHRRRDGGTGFVSSGEGSGRNSPW